MKIKPRTYSPDLLFGEELWNALQNRDESYDAKFVYGVYSTGIFCRPSCPSRRPGRKQVIFFLESQEALLNGFRPCRRCQPENKEAKLMLVEVVNKACKLIEENVEGKVTLNDLGSKLNLNPQYLQRCFKKLMGITPFQYAEAYRLGQLKELLQQGEKVAGAIYEAGYSSSSRLYEKATGKMGMTPGTYRNGGMGMEILYTVVPCYLGLLLVAATNRGVCAVTLGENEEELLSGLHREYPRATISREQNQEFKEWVEALLEFIRGEIPDLKLPLDIQATAFQMRVWDELKQIPYGTTRSYGQVAASIGQPGAARAVAGACATNPVALVIPCHRVVKEDGSPGGYRWGQDRKKKILEQEAVLVLQKS